MAANPKPGEARLNGKGEWVDEHGNPMPAPGASGGREGVPEMIEDPATGKLVPKKPKPTPAPTPTPDPDDPGPDPGPDAAIAARVAWNKAKKEWERKKAEKAGGVKSPYP